MAVFQGAIRRTGATVPVTPSPDAAVDYSAMTNDQLGRLCRERGIAVPRRATKRQLLALLGA